MGYPSQQDGAMANRADSVLTIEELARYLKVSKSTLYKLCQVGHVPGRKVGRHWRFSKIVIDEWIGQTGIRREGRVKRA
jgi:excisionase family DNA binding protein